MAYFHKQIYTFNSAATDFIYLISRVNKLVGISKINGIEIREQRMQCKNLPSYIAKHKNIDKIAIECEFANSNSTVDLFPKLMHLQKALRNVIPNENDLSIAEQAAKLMQSYIERMAFDANENYGGMVLPELPLLTADQALLLLNEIHNRVYLSGAIHFANLKAILFQLGETNFVLQYGEKTTLEEHIYTFNLNNGFNPNDIPKDIDRAICKELNIHFNQWKNNNYESDPIPCEVAGFQLNSRVSSATPSNWASKQSLPKERREENNKILYDYQQSQKMKHYAWIACHALLTVIFAIPLITIPLAIYFSKRMAAHMDANEEANFNEIKIIKIERSGEEEQKIRATRQQFKKEMGVFIDKEKKVSTGKVVKYVTRYTNDRDDVFSSVFWEPIKKMTSKKGILDKIDEYADHNKEANVRIDSEVNGALFRR